MPGKKASLGMLQKKLDKMTQSQLMIMLKQLKQEKKRRKPKKAKSVHSRA